MISDFMGSSRQSKIDFNSLSLHQKKWERNYLNKNNDKMEEMK